MKNEKYLTVGTVPKFNSKLVETESIPSTYIYMFLAA